jgi:putative FmdB family regulatory protein
LVLADGCLGYNREPFFGFGCFRTKTRVLNLVKVVAVPIYEYRCEACDHIEEALQKMSDAALVDCPACNKPTLKKQISAAGFRLKGGGWYETDFKSGSKKNIAGEAGSSTSSGSTGAAASSSSESKPSASAPAASKSAD